MTTLDELVSYCKEEKIIGALLLTGEWGCGKTHLIENELKKELEQSYIIVRVSLFGVDSIETLNTLVKKEWASNCLPLWGKIGKFKKTLKAGETAFGSIASMIPFLKDAKDTVLAINPLDYITIKPTIKIDDNTKTVILVFDDLERAKSSIDVNDILGCINDYCENQQFHVIILANEERIKRNNNQCHDNTIAYEEIKEKIIVKTIQINPDYNAVITSLLDEETWFDDKYTEFLRRNKELIKKLFSSSSEIENDINDETKDDKPHNIRSLKCALHGFNRIYSEFLKVTGKEKHDKFDDSELSSLKLMLMQMIAFTMETKAGENIYKDLFLVSDEELSMMDQIIESDDPYSYMRRYPDDVFDRLIASKAYVRWIQYGEYNENQIRADIKKVIDRFISNRISKSELFLTTRVLRLDWTDFESGYKEALVAAYNGKLTSEQYVALISIIHQIKQYQIPLPEEPDYEKMTDAYDTVDVLNEEEPSFPYPDSRIVDENAKALYGRIKEKIQTRENEKQKKEYYDHCMNYFSDTNGAATQYFLSSNRIKITLDDKLIDAIVQSYKKASNKERKSIESAFSDIEFTDNRTSQTAPNLIQKLNELLLMDEIDPIGKVNIKDFISTVKTKFGIRDIENENNQQ